MANINKLRRGAWRDEPFEIAQDGDVWKRFDNFKEAQEWLNRTWEQLYQILSQVSQAPREQFRSRWEQITLVIRRLNSEDPDFSTANQYLTNLQSQTYHFFAPFREDKPSLDRLFAYCQKFDPNMAAAYWSALKDWPLLKPELPSTQLGVIYGYIDRQMISSDKFKEVNATTATQDAVRIKDQFQNTYSEYIAKLDAALIDMNQAAHGLREQTQAQRKWRKKYIGVAHRYRRLFLDKSKNEFESVLSHYREELAIKSPVDYWQNKAEFHQGRAEYFASKLKWAMIASLVVVIMLAAVLLLPVEEPLVSWLFGADNDRSWLFSRNTRTPPSPIAKVSAVASILALVYWTLRILNRNLLSHQHLASDASERVVMAKTYRAISSDKALADAADINVILNALFRPASDGFVKEDHGPTPPGLDWILNRGK